MKKIILLLILSFFQSVFAQEIAITIDDLPFVGNANQQSGNLRREKNRFLKIVETLKRYQVPVTGFVIPATIEKDQWQLLQAFHDAGGVIANHTYSHLNLNQVSAERYELDIEKADKVLQPLLEGPKYFRYPFLVEGIGDKRGIVKVFLKSHDYIIAPVTIDSRDYQFNQALLGIPWRQRKPHVDSIKKEYLDFIWAQTKRAEARALAVLQRPAKQILLLHMNTLNAYAIEDIIKLYLSHGYRFISLTEAMRDPYNH